MACCLVNGSGIDVSGAKRNCINTLLGGEATVIFKIFERWQNNFEKIKIFYPKIRIVLYLSVNLGIN